MYVFSLQRILQTVTRFVTDYTVYLQSSLLGALERLHTKYKCEASIEYFL